MAHENSWFIIEDIGALMKAYISKLQPQPKTLEQLEAALREAWFAPTRTEIV